MDIVILSLDPILPLLDIVRRELCVAQAENEVELYLDECDEEIYIAEIVNKLLNDVDEDAFWEALPPMPTYALDAIVTGIYLLTEKLLARNIISQYSLYRYHIDHINEMFIICED